ncbi:MAG: hypothetical protein H3Z52_08425 [archaeon]|nr:hypothetical protein [archaeon]MCP8316201.1 hypothetical protein [archaeon]MCP8320950.1 hypothetical protein [archaeon]
MVVRALALPRRRTTVIEKNTFLGANVAFNQLRNFLISQGAQILISQEPNHISCRHGSFSSWSPQNVGKQVSISIMPSMNGSKVLIDYRVRSMPFFISLAILGIFSFVFGFTLLLYLFSLIFLTLVAIISLILSVIGFIGIALYGRNTLKFAKDLANILELPPPPPPP